MTRDELLDKIRAEIMQLDYDTDYVDYDYDDMVQTETVHTICREEVIKIIDKYKAENEQRRINMDDILFDLYYKSAHRNEELEQTNEELEQTNARLSHKIEKQNQKISDMQKEIERLHKVFAIKDDARCELVKENKELKKEIELLSEENNNLQNDLKQAHNEIKLLNNQIDNLITENNQLKFQNKMLTKIGLNSIYGIHCCKNHCVYTDTDSIKSESEDE